MGASFATTERRLEQFLYVHDIPFCRQTKDDQNLTTWHYVVTPELLEVVLEYYALLKRRLAKKEDRHE